MMIMITMMYLSSLYPISAFCKMKIKVFFTSLHSTCFFCAWYPTFLYPSSFFTGLRRISCHSIIFSDTFYQYWPLHSWWACFWYTIITLILLSYFFPASWFFFPMFNLMILSIIKVSTNARRSFHLCWWSFSRLLHVNKHEEFEKQKHNNGHSHGHRTPLYWSQPLQIVFCFQFLQAY